MPVFPFHSEAELDRWLAGRPSPAEMRAVLQRPPHAFGRLGALKADFAGWSAEEIAHAFPWSHAISRSIFGNPTLSSEQAAGLIREALEQGMAHGQLSALGEMMDQAAAAGHPVPRQEILDRMRQGLARMAEDPQSVSTQESISLTLALLHNFWFELTEADIVGIWRARAKSPSSSDELLIHPAAPGFLLREVFARHGDEMGVMRGLALSGRLDEVPGARERLLEKGQPHIVAALAPYLSEAELRQGMQRLARFHPRSLLSFLESLDSSQYGRIRAEDLLPMLEAAESEMRLAGQAWAARMGVGPARQTESPAAPARSRPSLSP